MKNNNAKLEVLGKRRQGLQKELSAVVDQISNLVEEMLLPEYTERYVDTYWVKNNGYSKEKTWLIYTHVKAVKEIWDTGDNGINCLLICDSFQATNDDGFIFSLDSLEYFYSLGKPIKKSVYEKAKQDCLKTLENRL
jgi:uncharacterized protein YeeX (DUF496 family)